MKLAKMNFFDSFIKDFNSAFNVLIAHFPNVERQSKKDFVKTSYLWVFFGWFISLVIMLCGYIAEPQTGKMTIFIVMGIFAFFLKSMSDEFSKNKKANSTTILVLMPFIAFYLNDIQHWLLIVSLYFPALMLTKNFQIAMQYKALEQSEKTVSINLLVSSISFYFPVHALFSGRMNLSVSLILMSYIFFVTASALTTFIKTIMGKKDSSIFNFSITPIIFIIVARVVLTYLTVYFYY